MHLIKDEIKVITNQCINEKGIDTRRNINIIFMFSNKLNFILRRDQGGNFVRSYRMHYFKYVF